MPDYHHPSFIQRGDVMLTFCPRFWKSYPLNEPPRFHPGQQRSRTSISYILPSKVLFQGEPSSFYPRQFPVVATPPSRTALSGFPPPSSFTGKSPSRFCSLYLVDIGKIFIFQFSSYLYIISIFYLIVKVFFMPNKNHRKNVKL